MIMETGTRNTEENNLMNDSHCGSQKGVVTIVELYAKNTSSIKGNKHGQLHYSSKASK
jgi:hypothetical protein